jgi:hypothetical protein
VAGGAGTCGDTLFPSIMTRVAVFAPWIKQTTGLSAGVLPITPGKMVFIDYPSILLDSPRDLEMDLLTLAGTSLVRSRRFYRAGRTLAFPALPTGRYLIRILGDGIDVRRPILVIR